MHLHLNPLGGLAGDMFCAGVLDAFPTLFAELKQLIERLGTPIPVNIELQNNQGMLSGKQFLVQPANSAEKHHMSYAEIKALLQGAPLEQGVRTAALGIFQILAEAEAKVHGIAPDQVTFHEVGNWDSITDIVTAAFLLQRLNIHSASCAPLPLGSGRVQTAHGVLPVPAPATAELLRDLPVIDDGFPGERVTPTGAAILKFLRPQPRQPMSTVLKFTGRGFGTRELPGLPNCLQMLFLELATEEQLVSVDIPFRAHSDTVIVLNFEVDDQNPEDFAVAMQHLREYAGVLSVTSLQAIGKSARPTLKVEILCQLDHLTAVAEACFRETTTIGLRWQKQSRIILPRQQHEVEVEGRSLSVKTVQRPQGVTSKTENSDLQSIDNHASRERLRQAAAAAALKQELDRE